MYDKLLYLILLYMQLLHNRIGIRVLVSLRGQCDLGASQ